MTAELKPYPTMKDSGVEWLGMIPEHWDIERAKNLFTKMERPVRESDEVITCFRDGTVTLRRKRRTEGFTESLKEIGYQGIRVGDLVIHAMDAFAGAVGVADSDGKGTPVYAVCKPKSKANAQYHALVIREMARNKWILALATGIRERSTDFRFSTYANQRVPLPPIPEQVAIARYLDYVGVRVRRLTEAKRKLIGLLTEYKQAIIHRAVTRGLDPNVPLKDSGIEWLGMVPQHWEVRQFRTLATGFNNGTATDQLVSGESDYLVSRIETISKGIVDYSKVGYIASDHLVQAHYLKENDFLISHINSYAKVGNSARYDGAQPLLHGMNLIRVTPRNCVNSHFLGYLLKSQVFIGSMQRACKPAINQVSVTTVAMKGIILPLPPLPEQVAIVEYLDRTTAEIDIAVARAERQIELLNEYRTRLIADVVTGKLDVCDVTLTTEEFAS